MKILILLIICLLIQFITINSYNHDIIFNIKDNFYYLIVNNLYCQINKDNYNETISLLGFDINIIQSIKDITNSQYKVNKLVSCPIKYDSFGSSYCETIKDKVLFKNIYLTNKIKIIESIHNIGRYFNPFILPFYGKLLLIHRYDPYLYLTNYQFNSFKPFHYKVNIPINHENDYRMLHIPNNTTKGTGYVLLVYNYDKYYPCCIYTGIRKLYYDINNKDYTLSDPLRLDYNNSLVKEKNWTPFQYYDNIYYIQQINPLHVLKESDKPFYHTHFVYRTVRTKEVITVSKTSCSNIHWDYGEMRGGTQATHISGYGFLSFFHSYKVVCHRYYFIGAYIFSDRIPFKILKLSYEPIVDDDLFVDLKFGFNHISVVFPMSYYLEDQSGNVLNGNYIESKPHKIVMSVGYNDSEALIVRLNFDNLIESLVDVDCS